VTSREDLTEMVVQRDFAGLDSLPLSLKLSLIGRLVDGLNIDLDHVKGLIWEPENSNGFLPTLGGTIREGSARVRDDWSTPTERSSGLIPLNHQTTMETPPG